MGARQVAGLGLNVATNVVLARALAPADFGVYAIVTFIVNFLTTLSDVGLGASIIRQEEEPSLSDYRALWTVQLSLVSLVVLGVGLAAPLLVRVYRLPTADVWLFRAMALTLVLASFQSVSAQRLERRLEFSKLAAVEFAQALAYSSFAIAFALSGLGVWSFVLAALLRSILGAIALNMLEPWPMALAWGFKGVGARLRFGLFIQGSALVSVAKDSLTPTLIGLLAGAQAVGWVNWAQLVGAYPVLAMAALGRVYLPAFAKLQSDPEGLSAALARVLTWTNRVAAPLALLIVVLARPITVIVFGAKWLPALPMLYFFAASNVFVPTAGPLIGVFNSMGRSGLTFAFTCLWMAMTWVLGLPLVLWLGPIGYSVANLLVQLTNMLLIREAKRVVSTPFWPPILAAWGPALLSAVLVWLAERAQPVDGALRLALYGALGLVVYLASVGFLFGRTVKADWRWLWKGGLNA